VKEESGYEIVVKKLAAVYDRDKHGHPPMPYHVYKLFFVCELWKRAKQSFLGRTNFRRCRPHGLRPPR
jgi:ADP-ribose pyrophosphatase YjhB (NUDIX family)